MKLIVNLKYHTFDSHMSDSNVGGRRKKSGINHIWVMNSVIHDTLSSTKKTSIVVTKYDNKQMFDGMDSEESCGDIFEYGVDDDQLKLIYEANKEVAICVETPSGTSTEYKLINRIMQGDTWAPGQASAQVDMFGKEMLEEVPNYMFKFKEEVPITLLGQVDDLLGVAEQGYKAEQLNGFVNVKTSDKELQFGIEKCNFMVVSKKKNQRYIQLNLCVDSWKLKHKEDNTFEEDYAGKVPMEEKKLSTVSWIHAF